MRLNVLAGLWCLLPALILLTVLHVKADQHQPRERHYYIAAVEINWDYSGNDSHRFGHTYKKVVYREYDKDFREPKTHPSWLGLLGPTLRAEEGDMIVVTFRNKATGPHSIHPHGVAYGKQSEGANYFDNTSLKEKEDDMVQPNGEHVYYWEVTSDVSPQPDDPTCLTYTYISHQNVVEDYNSGLIGTLLICKPGSLDELGNQISIDKEYVFLFGVFDERESKYKPNSYSTDNNVKYTINGFTEGSLPDVSLCAHASVSLHMTGMSSEPEVFSVHMNGQVLQQTGHKVSSIGLISGSSTTATMTALHTGRWLLSSHTVKHMEAGMHGLVEVKTCDGFEAPKRKMTIAEKRNSREWTYYIAAEEMIWDYAPDMPEYIDEDFELKYLKQSSKRIGGRYKKAVFTLYKNESFTERLETKQRKNELGILGPVIRAQIRDVIKIVFKNMASRPYSIYPHGLTIEKSEEGVNYPAGSNQSHGVQPGEVHTYVWRVVDEDEPLDKDSRCLTRMYHSAVDAPRDIASGLIGPILICKSQSLNVRNVQLKADKEQHAMFAVFDENKSWYLDDNIKQYCDRSRVNKADPEFYKSNVMHTINGYVFESGPLLGFCNGEVATWHVSSIGAQDYIQTVTFYGHPFELNERTEDFLSLYPMTGETITMNMDNIGVWLLASLTTHETTKGIRIKFQDVQCYRDYQYEYSDYDDQTTDSGYTVWVPPSLDEVKKEEKQSPTEETLGEIDIYTAQFADELGLRSRRNQSHSSDVEELDLSFLNYFDFVDEDLNIPLNYTDTNSQNKTSISNGLNRLNETLLTRDKLNLTAVNLLTQSFNENSTNLQNSSRESTFNNSFMYKTENTTDFYSSNISLRNDSIHSNSSGPVVASSLDNVVMSDIKNTSFYTGAALPVVGNTSTEIINFTVTLQEIPSSILGRKRKDITLESDDQTAVNETSTEGSVTKLTKVDGFTYDVHLINSSTDILNSTSDGNVTRLSHNRKIDDGNKTEAIHQNASADGKNHTLSDAIAFLRDNSSRIERHNLTVLERASTENRASDSLITARQPVCGLQTNCSASLEDNSSTENATDMLFESVLPGNMTLLMSRLNSLAKLSQELEKNITVLLTEFNDKNVVENDSLEFSNLSVSGNAVTTNSSEDLSDSESTEEVFIYLKENHTDLIKTTSAKINGHSWAYEGTHQMVSMDIPNDMMKYFDKKTTHTTAPPKKVRKVNRPKRPQKGQGMKTRKRKEYKPQPRSGLPFSPRGFNPGIVPRGSRPSALQPFSDEDLINMPVVIGVPRPDFSEYELYIPGGEPDHLGLDEQDVKADEYEYVSYKDPYSSHEDIKNFNMDETTKYFLKFTGTNVRTYFIAAEEVEWDYAGYGQRRQEKSLQSSRETKFTKVVFRSYMDSSFTVPEIRGEIDEHLGILGPVIKAEVGQTLMVVFKNNAARPYSLHPNGVSYTKQTEGLSYEDGSKYWYKYDNEVQPNTSYVYIWKVHSSIGPTPEESHCRTWAYYSGVNPERDMNSGLIGPLLVCREGTLDREITDMREFTLLFMTFDESKSWYYEKNYEVIQRKSRRRVMEPNFKENLKFYSINGIIYSLKGLRMYTNQLVCWHLINLGSPKDFQSVHFHGQTFIHKKTTNYRQAVHPLLPGSFATLEMYPLKPGLWQLKTEVGFNQQKGMQTLFLVLDNDCHRPLGLESGSVKDDEITAVNTRGYWEPRLARLNNQGKYNAWSTEQNSSWIQVDFQRPVVISQVATQGARQLFHSQFVQKYSISYSTDRRKWIFYKGGSKGLRKVFPGNQEAYETKTNDFFPPVVGRFIRLHPIEWYNTATVRMEFYGCELDGCSVPLGMESGLIEDHRITASSTASSWFSGPWKPSLGRLNRQGTVNAWQAKYNDRNQWLQVELPQIKKITGIITQGAKSLRKEMYVQTYTLQYSDNGIHWNKYTDDEARPFKIFSGNTDNNDHVKNYIYPPIFSRFIRISPKTWTGSITMRIELLGCEFE
ncbi:coagulation factor V [Antennarius striatus]|uniref:coagulation factor V n=1 Tax=Antennarius striatus TaxID=241820 RepID=UPI0035B396C3